MLGAVVLREGPGTGEAGAGSDWRRAPRRGGAINSCGGPGWLLPPLPRARCRHFLPGRSWPRSFSLVFALCPPRLARRPPFPGPPPLLGAANGLSRPTARPPARPHEPAREPQPRQPPGNLQHINNPLGTKAKGTLSLDHLKIEIQALVQT